MNVSVAEVLAGAAARAVPLSAECAGYLVLAAADQVSAAPRRVEPGDVLLGDDGAVRVASGRAAETSLAERDLRAVLDALLLRASAPTAGLLRASRREAGAGLDALVRELETALIPVNRSAAKRSLARLERETVRALQSGHIELASVEERAVPAEHEIFAAPTPAKPSVLPPIPELSPPLPASSAPTPVPPAVAAVQARGFLPLPEPDSMDVEPVTPVIAVERTEPLRERTAVVGRVAPKPARDSDLVETRPEPVVKRASLRAPADLEPTKTEPLPKPAAPRTPEPRAVYMPPIVMVDVESRPNVTPFLGTRISESVTPPPPGNVGEPETGAEGGESNRGETSRGEFVVRASNGDPPDSGSLAEDGFPQVLPEPVAAPLEMADLVELSSDELEPLEEDSAVAQPSVAVAEPSVAVAEPSVAVAEPSVAVAEPSVAVAEPVVAVAEPVVAVAEPVVAEPVVFADSVAVEPVTVELPLAEQVATELLALSADPGFVDDGDVEIIEVIFDPADVTVIPADDELIEAQAAELTEPCPPIAPSDAEQEACVELVAASCAEVAESSGAVVRHEPEAPEEIELAALVESALPPWVVVAPEVNELTPPPRVALPEQRPSDVDDLLRRLEEIPLPVGDLRAGLKRLAGLDLTPPPGLALDP